VHTTLRELVDAAQRRVAQSHGRASTSGIVLGQLSEMQLL
jgi:hypothetical protein